MKNTAWLDRNEYPFDSKYTTINGQEMHYIDEGQGEVLLFVHGTPSWSFDYRHQIKSFSKQYRCIAIDHLGFGLSAKPQNYNYTTQQHAKNLNEFIQKLGLKNITLVVHDFGGPIGFDYALKNPDNIAKIVVLNSWLWSAEEEPEFKKMRKILKSPLLPFLYKWMNLSPKVLLPQSYHNKKKLSKAIHQQYLKPFAKRNERKGTLAFARSLLNDQSWFESLWGQRAVLKTKPCLFIWGMNDTFILPKYLDQFVTAFEQKTVVKIDNCGHYPQDEAKDEVNEAMLNFLVKHKQKQLISKQLEN